MLFQYIGSDDAPRTVTIYDYFFEIKGEPVEVTNVYHIEKLKNNGSFLWDKGGNEQGLAIPADEPAIEEIEEVEEVVVMKKKRVK
jgi:hypothetical protein